MIATTNDRDIRNFMTVDQASEYCGLSRQRLQQMVHADEIPFIKIGYRYMLHKGKLQGDPRKRSEDRAAMEGVVGESP